MGTQKRGSITSIWQIYWWYLTQAFCWNVVFAALWAGKLYVGSLRLEVDMLGIAILAGLQTMLFALFTIEIPLIWTITRTNSFELSLTVGRTCLICAIVSIFGLIVCEAVWRVALDQHSIVIGVYAGSHLVGLLVAITNATKRVTMQPPQS